jgi:hypothetical protein
MTHGNIYRFHSRLGSQRCPDKLPFVKQFSLRASVLPERLMLTTKDRLRAAYGRQVEKKSHMRGKPKPPWMRNPLAINQNKVGDITQSFTGGQY